MVKKAKKLRMNKALRHKASVKERLLAEQQRRKKVKEAKIRLVPIIVITPMGNQYITDIEDLEKS